MFVAMGCNGCQETFLRKGQQRLLGARTLLGAPGLTTRNKKLLGGPGIATRSRDATRANSKVQRSKNKERERERENVRRKA